MQSPKRLSLFILLTITCFIVVQSCKIRHFRSNYKNANQLIHHTENLTVKPFLKVHMLNGDICILFDTWRVDSKQEYVWGTGKRFDYNRNLVFEGKINIPFDDVALFETNTKIESNENTRIAALSILTAVNVGIGILCFTNPKACFGSCPTFYWNGNDNFHYADAEGFSNAILPSMEYGDIDAIDSKMIKDGRFSLTMKNEALETHCIKDVKVLAYPIKEGERVYQSTRDVFFLCEGRYEAHTAIADEGDISTLLNTEDKKERFSLSDGDNLNSKESIFLNFGEIQDLKDIGLILNFRQTLMTTYLFYSAMGYMGDQVADRFAMLETDSVLRGKFDATTQLLGGIEVYVFNAKNNEWELQSSFDETGPIAVNKQITKLKKPSSGEELKLKIILNKGLWRIDYAGITEIKKQIKPIEIIPKSILNKSVQDDAALDQILDQEQYLISMPGSEYQFNFCIDQNMEEQNYEFFLYSKGYYLEWMRESWLKDKNIFKLNQMVYQPKTFLRNQAAEFKKYETSMEEQFWNSRIDTKNFSYHEN